MVPAARWTSTAASTAWSRRCAPCTLWLWLDLRFPDVYGKVDDVLDLRQRLNDGIERQLKGKKPLARRPRRGR